MKMSDRYKGDLLDSWKFKPCSILAVEVLIHQFLTICYLAGPNDLSEEIIDGRADVDEH